MARNGSGTMSKAVSDFVFDTTISHTDMNTLIDDIIGEISNSVDKDGQTTWTGLMKRSVTVGQTANTGSVQGGNPIVSAFYEIATCANAGDAVTLPSAVAGQQVIIANNGANSADVFPASGDKIDGGSANAANALAAGSNRLYICQDATDWDTIGAGATELSSDGSPQLGGQLDVNGQAIGDGTLELLKFTETGSAVNEFTIANAASGSGPTISATGTDSNVGINITPKGTGVVTITSTMNPSISSTGKALVLGF